MVPTQEGRPLAREGLNQSLAVALERLSRRTAYDAGRYSMRLRCVGASGCSTRKSM